MYSQVLHHWKLVFFSFLCCPHFSDSSHLLILRHFHLPALRLGAITKRKLYQIVHEITNIPLNKTKYSNYTYYYLYTQEKKMHFAKIHSLKAGHLPVIQVNNAISKVLCISNGFVCYQVLFGLIITPHTKSTKIRQYHIRQNVLWL